MTISPLWATGIRICRSSREGFAGLAKKIEAMGLKFGLWFDLEMTNKKSRLYEEHPVLDLI